MSGANDNSAWYLGGPGGDDVIGNDDELADLFETLPQTIGEYQTQITGLLGEASFDAATQHLPTSTQIIWYTIKGQNESELHIDGYIQNSFGLTYELDGGAWSTTDADGSRIGGTGVDVEDEVPRKAGYTFEGWLPDPTNLLPEGKSTFVGNDTFIMPFESVTLTAQWERDPVTITFNGNGATGTMDAQTVLRDVEEALNENVFDYDDREFLGWSTTPTTTPATQAGVVYTDKAFITASENMTLYAVWGNKQTVTVTYFPGANGTILPEGSVFYVDPGKPINEDYEFLSPAEVGISPRDGYDFLWWNTTNEDGTLVSGTEKYLPDGTELLGADFPVVAVWAPMVTFDLNLADNATATFSDDSTENKEIVANVDVNVDIRPTSETNGLVTGSVAAENFSQPKTGLGYTFGGWVDEDGDPVTTATRFTAPTTVYAKWTVNEYTLTFYNNDGTNAYQRATGNVLTGFVDIDNIEIPIRDYYDFMGWHTNANASSTDDGILSHNEIGSIQADDNKEYYAVWKAKEYTVTYVGNHASVQGATPAETATDEAAYAAAANGFSVAEHNFISWNTEQNGGGTSYSPGTEIPISSIAEDGITLYAQWAEWDQIVFSVDTPSLTYNQNNQQLFTLQENTLKAGDRSLDVEDVIFQYRVKGTTEWTVGWPSSTDVPAAGAQYEIQALPAAGNEYRASAIQLVTPDMAKVEVELTPKHDAITYGDDAPSAGYTFTYTGMLTGEDWEGLVRGTIVQDDYSTTYVKGNDASNYSISITDTAVARLSATNYTFTAGRGTLQVNKAELMLYPLANQVIIAYNTPAPIDIPFGIQEGIKNNDSPDGPDGLIAQINAVGTPYTSNYTQGLTTGTFDITVNEPNQPTEIRNYFLKYNEGSFKGRVEKNDSAFFIASATGYTGTYDRSSHQSLTGLSIKVGDNTYSFTEEELATGRIFIPGIGDASVTFAGAVKNVAEAGEKFVTITPDNEGYASIENHSYTVSISQAAAEVRPTADPAPYGTLNAGLVFGYEVLVGGVVQDYLTLSAAPSGYATDYDATEAANRSADTYELRATLAAETTVQETDNTATGNYRFELIAATHTITKANLVVTAPNRSTPYGVVPPNPALGYEVSGLQYGETEVQAGLSDVNAVGISTTATNTSLPGAGELQGEYAGQYAINLSGSVLNDADVLTNYVVTEFKDGALNIINSDEMDIEGTAHEGTYDATEHDAFPNGVDVVFGNNDNPDVTITYSTDGTNFDAEMPAFTDAGEYTVYVRAEADGYETVTIERTVTIAPKDVSITPENAGKTMGEDDPDSFIANVLGTEGTDTLDYTVSRVPGETVGTYDIIVTLNTQDQNYNITLNVGTFTISAVVVDDDTITDTTTDDTITPAPAAPAPAAPAPAAPAPAAPVAIAAPAAPAVPAALTLDIPDAEIPLADGGDVAEDVQVQIGDTVVPLAAADGSWSLINLLLAIVTALGSVFLLIAYFAGKKHEENQNVKRKGIFRLVSAPVAILSAVIFILTQDMSLPMALVDNWTLIMAVILLVQVLIAVLSRKKVVDDDEEKPQHA